MMKNLCSSTSDISLAPSVELKTIWDVGALPGYDCRKNSTSKGSLIAIRTLSGEGCILLEDFGKLELSPESLVIVEQQKIIRYFCTADNWDFWWFEFTMYGPLPFPLHRNLQIPEQPADRQDLAICQSLLISTLSSRRILASSTFSTMLHRWLVAWDGQPKETPHRQAVDKVIMEMHKRHDNFSVKEMAAMSFLGERRFRQVFMQITGSCPKKYYDRLRVQTAEAWLSQGLYNVSEASMALGFSSPFHFSKTFKTHLGYPPSRASKTR